MGISSTSAGNDHTKVSSSPGYGNFTKGPLGEPPLPTVPRQGSAGQVYTKLPRIDDKAPDGHQEPVWDMDQPLRRGIYPTPQGGTGDGPNKGDSLPL